MMLEASKHLDQTRAILDNNQPAIIQVMTNIRGVQINPGNADDIEYAQTLFMYLAELYQGYARCFCGKDVMNRETPEGIAAEKALLIEFSCFAKAILGVKDLSDDMLYQFCLAAEELAKNASRRNNVVLNRKATNDVIKRALETNRQNRLRQKARDVKQMMGNT